MDKSANFVSKENLKTRILLFFLVIGCASLWMPLAKAQEPDSLDSHKISPQTENEKPTEQSVASQNLAPYAMPWQLRTIIPGTGARFDSAVAFYDDKNGNAAGTAIASMLGGNYKLLPELALSIRVGFVNNNPPASAPSATSFINPFLGGLYSFKLSSDFRLGFFLGVTVPLGTGGGNYPDPAIQSANSAGILARSAMDNALFAVNYFTVIPGVDLAYIAHGFTVQLEATLLQLTRVRGEQIDKDPSRTNFTSGVAVGYAFSPQVFLESELRYQRWLDNQTVAASASPATENLSFAVGPRFQLKTGNLTMKPGLAYAQGISGPMAHGGYTYPTNSDKIIFFDIPVSF